MTPPPGLSVVVPCYNEERRIGELERAIEEFERAWGRPFELVVVDDGSRDATAARARESSVFSRLAAMGRFELVRLEKNQGKGAALQAGVARTRGEVVLTLDADVAAHPSELLAWESRLGRPFGGEEVLIACRPHPESHLVDKPLRQLAGGIFNRVVRLLTPLRVRDSQCGFKLYPGDLARRLFAELRTLGWAHDVELLCRAQALGAAVREMPICWAWREGSKVSLVRDSWRMFWQVVRIALAARRRA